MAERPRDEPIAPRRTLKGPVLPPPPPELAEESRKAEEKDKAKQERAAAKSAARERRDAQRQADSRFRVEAEKRAAAGSEGSAASGRSDGSAAAAGAAGAASGAAVSSSSGSSRPSRGGARAERSPRGERRERADRSQRSGPATAAAGAGAAAAAGSASGGSRSQERPTRPATAKKAGAPRRTRRAQLRLVQVDAWSVMKTAFLLSIALGIVLVVAVAIIWSVLGAAGVWTNINSIVQQAVGGESGSQFDIRQYVGTSRILGFTMIVAAVDVILITAIATLGAFLYNLSAALLGGIEVTLAEDG